MLLPAYSIAKPFTVAGLLAAGVRLEDSIGNYVDCPISMRSLRVDALMRHRSGLPDYGGWTDYRTAVANREDAWPDEAMLARTAGLIQEPGEFRYSNIGYMLLRQALQQLTSTTDLFSALNTVVFPALDMHDVAPLNTRADWARAMGSHVADVAQYDPRWVYTGTFLASPEALETGLRNLLQGRLFDPEPMLQSIAVDAPGHVLQKPGYALGVMTSGMPPRFVGHGGGGPGFTLVALATSDGAKAAVEWANDEVSDQPLFAAALARLRRDETQPQR